MKNLVHHSPETLENSPQKLSMRWNPHFGWGLKPYDRYYRDNEAFLRICKKAERIIKGSVGKDWTGIHSRLCSLIKNLPFEFRLDWVLNDVHIPFWNTREQKWKYMTHGRYECDLEWQIDMLQRMSSNHVEYFYYVDPHSNKLCLVKSKLWSFSKNKRT